MAPLEMQPATIQYTRSCSLRVQLQPFLGQELLMPIVKPVHWCILRKQSFHMRGTLRNTRHLAFLSLTFPFLLFDIYPQSARDEFIFTGCNFAVLMQIHQVSEDRYLIIDGYITTAKPPDSRKICYSFF